MYGLSSNDLNSLFLLSQRAFGDDLIKIGGYDLSRAGLAYFIAGIPFSLRNEIYVTPHGASSSYKLHINPSNIAQSAILKDLFQLARDDDFLSIGRWNLYMDVLHKHGYIWKRNIKKAEYSYLHPSFDDRRSKDFFSELDRTFRERLTSCYPEFDGETIYTNSKLGLPLNCRKVIRVSKGMCRSKNKFICHLMDELGETETAIHSIANKYHLNHMLLGASSFIEHANKNYPMWHPKVVETDLGILAFDVATQDVCMSKQMKRKIFANFNFRLANQSAYSSSPVDIQKDVETALIKHLSRLYPMTNKWWQNWNKEYVNRRLNDDSKVHSIEYHHLIPRKDTRERGIPEHHEGWIIPLLKADHLQFQNKEINEFPGVLQKIGCTTDDVKNILQRAYSSLVSLEKQLSNSSDLFKSMIPKIKSGWGSFIY